MIIDYLSSGLTGFSVDEFPEARDLVVEFSTWEYGLNLTYTVPSLGIVMPWGWLKETEQGDHVFVAEGAGSGTRCGLEHLHQVVQGAPRAVLRGVDGRPSAATDYRHRPVPSVIVQLLSGVAWMVGGGAVEIQAIIAVAAGAAVTATAASTAVATHVRAIREVAEELGRLRGRIKRSENARDDIRVAKRLLGFHQRDAVLYRHDNVHLLYSGTPTMHPDNQHALVAAAGGDYWTARERGTLDVVPHVDARLDDNLVLIGSPTSEGISRIAFGYTCEELGNDSLVQANSPVDLPYRMVLNYSDVPEGALARRYVPGRGEVARRNWRIITETEMFVPETGTGGWLRTDYLLVTRLRNFLTAEGLAQGHSLLSLSGTHGTGTRAVELLMRDRRILRELAALTEGRSFASFQALFKVSDIEHDPVRGSRARHIELVGSAVIGDEPMRWQTARELVARDVMRREPRIDPTVAQRDARAIEQLQKGVRGR
ncbi:hypothetical protein [Actinoplanes auranticolor]|uniref:Uncharacterized protein n=1 Tax=Actinoplanes auranticolor TaxID=47988 RepID=A0A919SNR9_9ACTN|nr:hypothetical protein [Actinoplanes auranticolor]GIM75586.1 hypothetical protein Aau02nite_66670 [Actinoplanes auranticolor]